MSEPTISRRKKDAVPFYIHFDEMGWPLPDLTDDDSHSIEWKLRYAPQHLTREEQLGAASIISAYYHLIMSPERKRNRVAAVLKRAVLAWNRERRAG